MLFLHLAHISKVTDKIAKWQICGVIGHIITNILMNQKKIQDHKLGQFFLLFGMVHNL